MSYSHSLAARVRLVCGGLRGVVEKRMFGGAAFLLDGNILVGVWKNSLVVRVGAERYSDLLKAPYASEFNVTGSSMTGWILIEPDGVESDSQLRSWIDRALEFVRTLPPKSAAPTGRSKLPKAGAKASKSAKKTARPPAVKPIRHTSPQSAPEAAGKSSPKSSRKSPPKTSPKK